MHKWLSLALVLVVLVALVTVAGCGDSNPAAPTPALTISDFGADAYNITHGSTTTLHWTVVPTTAHVRIDSGGVAPGDVPSTGSVTVMPSVSTWYSITATLGTAMVKRTITIEVRP